MLRRTQEGLVCVQADFAPENTVSVDLVGESEYDPGHEPCEPRRQSIGIRGGVKRGQAECRIGRRYQDVWIHAAGDAAQHRLNEQAGDEEGGHVVLPMSEVEGTHKCQQAGQRQKIFNGMTR